MLNKHLKEIKTKDREEKITMSTEKKNENEIDGSRENEKARTFLFHHSKEFFLGRKKIKQIERSTYCDDGCHRTENVQIHQLKVLDELIMSEITSERDER